MSAPTPVSSPAAGGDTRPYEPSMEEILASIRRIIADDQSLPGRTRAEAEPKPGEDAPATVHLLRTDESEMPVSDMMLEPEGDAMAAQGLVSAPQFAGLNGPLNDPSPSRPLAEPQPGPSGSVADEPAISPLSEHAAATTLLSSATNRAVSSAFNVLAASRLADNSAELLGMTREMVRPLLQAWLDDNLPALVERLVRDEIERVARGGR